MRVVLRAHDRRGGRSRSGRLRLLLVLLACAAALGSAQARAAPDLIVGVSDDRFLWAPEDAAGWARDLGVTAFRVSLRWDGTASSLSGADARMLERVVDATTGLRMIVAIYGERGVEAPASDGAREAYCSYAADLVRRFPTIRDVVAWNEVNLGYFWRPQFDAAGASVAPRAYAALLAACWDAVHAVRPDANLIAVVSSRGNDRPNAKSNVSHSPANFIARLGEAYRASGRPGPIFDTFAEHPYAQSSDPPWATHPGTGQISQGDLPRLLEALSGAFAGTGQPVPGSCQGKSCPTVWYLEAGYQTVPAAEKAGLYHDFETEPHPVPDGDGTGKRRDGGRQLRDGVSLAYCQPAVGAFFNFLLADESGLAGWQSGVLWADGSPKKSYEAFRSAAREVATSGVDCAAVEAGQAADSEESSSPAARATGGAPRDVVVRRAIAEASAYANRTMRLRGLAGLRARRSTLDPRWILVVGNHRAGTMSGRLAVWIRLRPGGPRAVKGVYGAAALRPQPDVPCDVSRAFVRRVCLKNETTALGAYAHR